MKVFGGLTFVKGKLVRTIVATTSKRKACDLLGINLSGFQWWSATQNAGELKVALAKPNTVFVASTSMSKDFTEKAD